jgi:hypothetical protein
VKRRNKTIRMKRLSLVYLSDLIIQPGGHLDSRYRDIGLFERYADTPIPVNVLISAGKMRRSLIRWVE